MSWGPIKRVDKVLPTSGRTAIVRTDDGEGYLKGLGGPEGPHALACELIGTRAAKWLGLKVLDFEVITLSGDDCLAFPEESAPKAGAAFITRSADGHTWGGTPEELEALVNPEDINGLVVLDTWLLNCDRYRPKGSKPLRENLRNVFFSDEGAPHGKFVLLAIDHTHALTCGKTVTEKISGIASTKSTDVFGLFPAFVPELSREGVARFAKVLSGFTKADARGITADIPVGWSWSSQLSDSINNFLTTRAGFLGHQLEDMLAAACGWAPVLDFEGDENG